MIRIHDQHFSLGDHRAIAVQINKPTRRKAGLKMFTVWEMVKEMGRRLKAKVVDLVR